MSSMVNPRNATTRRPLPPRPTWTPSEEETGVDHDDLLALLDRPRPAHGDLSMLLKRRSAGSAQALDKAHMAGEPE
jgi:hypothetical protein